MRGIDWIGMTILGAVVVGILVNIWLRTAHFTEELKRLIENEGIMLDYLRQIDHHIRPQIFDRNVLAQNQRQVEQRQRLMNEHLQRAMNPPQIADPRYYGEVTRTGMSGAELWATFGQRPTPDPEPGLAD